MKRFLLALVLLWPGASFAAELVQHLPADFCLDARAAAAADQQMLLWTQCLASEPLTPRQRATAYNAIAVLYVQKEDYQNALTNLNSAVSADPTFAVSFINRGAVYRRMENFDSAIADLTTGIKLDPTVAPAYLERGSALASLKRYDEAIADFTAVITVDPKYALTGLSLRAYAHLDKKDWADAITDCNLALKIKDATTLYSIRAVAYANSAQYAEAVADFSAVIAREPTNVIAYNNRGTTYGNMQRHDLAIADYSKAISISPSRASSYVNRGSEYDEIANCKSAVADLDKALAFGADGAAYAIKSWVRSTCPASAYRNGAESLDLAIKALTTGSSLGAGSTFHMALAAAYAENGQFDDALAMQQLAIKLTPDDALDSFKTKLNLALQAFTAKQPFRWPAQKLASALESALPASGFAASGHAPHAPTHGSVSMFLTQAELPPPQLPLHLINPMEPAP